MRIDNIHIKNFRGYADLKVDFKSNFNVIIGDNGSGKTAILEALTVAMGSFFLGIRNVDAKGISSKDVRIASYEFSEEYQFPVEIKAEGRINNYKLEWERGLHGLKNRATVKGAHLIKEYAKFLDHSISNGETISLPVLVYYATGRLFNEGYEKLNLSQKEDSKKRISSRFRAYDRCLEAISTHKKFQNWFRDKEIARIQKRTEDIALRLVQKAIIDNLPDCSNFYFEFDPDKAQGLKVEFTDGRVLPFQYLSDGTRNFFALLSDIAYKAITLNPHLKENALLETEGIVLIDELDLHLHPDWQRRIVDSLKNTFPKIQFICTTHSPFIIQATEEDELLIIVNNKIRENNSGVNLSIEDIAEIHQKVENPQWSIKRQELYRLAPLYYKAIKNNSLTEELKKEFDEAVRPFTMDTAFFSVIEEEKILQEYLKNKNESNK
ncbi:AAA family ATPase [Chryseobacterium sp.]|uniref:AAA family ATPase n=1 Tax=Chryseobacterium sp. TaxID=1871047 RepID=UPI0024E1BB73|nr:AAA family ATPase [Chryseobacterium sp.]